MCVTATNALPKIKFFEQDADQVEGNGMKRTRRTGGFGRARMVISAAAVLTALRLADWRIQNHKFILI